MTNKIQNIFRKNPDYFLLVIGSLLSTIGMALTGIAVYGTLAKVAAPASQYSYAFILQIVPGVFTSYLARRHFRSINLAKCLIGAELLGGLAILAPVIGAATDSLGLIMFAVGVTSAVTGFMLPFHDTHLKRVLEDDEIGAVAVLSTYSFAITFIFGTLAGTLVYPLVSSAVYFLLDSLTYFVSVGFTVWAWHLRPKVFTPVTSAQSEVNNFSFKNLTPIQKIAFSLSLIMAINCAPATAILPSVAKHFDLSFSFGPISLMPVLTLLIFKTIGQLLGPLSIKNLDFDQMIANRRIVPACLLIFHLLYFVVFNSTNFTLVLAAVTLAHIASNVVFILGYYALRRHFDENEISSASSVQYQASILVMALSSLWAGYLAEHFSYNMVLLFSLGGWLAYVALMLVGQRKDHKKGLAHVE